MKFNLILVSTPRWIRLRYKWMFPQIPVTKLFFWIDHLGILGCWIWWDCQCGCSMMFKPRAIPAFDIYTPWKPKIDPAEKEIPIGNHHFNPMFVFRGVYTWTLPKWNKQFLHIFLGGLIPSRRNFRNPTHRTNQQPTISAIRFTDSRLPKTFFGGNSGLEQFREKFPKTRYGNTPPWKLTIPKRPKKKRPFPYKGKERKVVLQHRNTSIFGVQNCMLVSGEGMMDGNFSPESWWWWDSFDESKPGKERQQPLLEAWNERGWLQVP